MRQVESDDPQAASSGDASAGELALPTHGSTSSGSHSSSAEVLYAKDLVRPAIIMDAPPLLLGSRYKEVTEVRFGLYCDCSTEFDCHRIEDNTVRVEYSQASDQTLILYIPSSLCNSQCTTDDFLFVSPSRMALSVADPRRAVISALSHVFDGQRWRENRELRDINGQRKQVFFRDKSTNNFYYFGAYDVLHVYRDSAHRADEWMDVDDVKKAGVSVITARVVGYS